MSGDSDPDGLVAMARAADYGTWAVSTVRALAIALVVGRHTEEAPDLLVPAHLHHPSDLWLNFLQGHALETRDPPHLDMAGCYYRAALALRPDSGRLRRDVKRLEKPIEILSGFRRRHGWRDERTWFSFDVTYSAMTERRQRLYVKKDAVTRALLAWPSDVTHKDFEEPPLPWPDGTLFVSEEIKPDGSVWQTYTYRIRSGRNPEFLRFTPTGYLAYSTWIPGATDFLPNTTACARCHSDPTVLLPPACDFPEEKTIRRFEVGDECRDLGIVLRFREYLHKESPVLAPYGAIWLTKLRSGELTPEDKDARDALKTSYPKILGK
jgi:hypothetical protein